MSQRNTATPPHLASKKNAGAPFKPSFGLGGVVDLAFVFDLAFALALAPEPRL
jgi:hypothetical protein